MKKLKILILSLIIIASCSTTFAASLDSSQLNSKDSIISPQSYVDEVINYTKEIYVYDSYWKAWLVDSQTVYKTITFRNGYELVDTREEFEANWNGYTIWTYYEYETY